MWLRDVPVGPMSVPFPLRSFLVIALLVCIRSQIAAAPPTLDHLYPVALARGSTNLIQAIGALGTWPAAFWVDGAGIEVQPQTNAGTIRVVVSPQADLGPHFIRAFNDEGASGPRFIVIEDRTLIAEVEPNDEFKKPQMIASMPVWVNGRLDRSGDVDSYAVFLNKGDTLIAKLEAYVLASPVDAVLRVMDPSHVQVALNHDDGESFDPFVTWTALHSGLHVVQVFGFAYPAGSDVRFSGGNSSVYGLALSKGRFVRHTIPLGVQLGHVADVECVGWNWMGSTQRAVPAVSKSSSDANGFAWVRLAGVENAVRVCTGTGPELIEHEPNDQSSQATELPIPSAVTGRLYPANDQDRYRLLIRPGDALVLRVRSASLGFSLDPWLRIEDSAGNELARNDDTIGADPMLEWTGQGTNPVFAVVGHVLHRADPHEFYRLSVESASPTLELSVPAHAFTIKAGETNEVKVAVKRLHGFAAKLVVSAEGLPQGITATPVEVSDQGSEAKLTWIASAGVQKFNGPLRIIAKPVSGGDAIRARFSLISSGTDNGVPNGFGKLLISSIDLLWLTVIPQAPPVTPAPASPPKK